VRRDFGAGRQRHPAGCAGNKRSLVNWLQSLASDSAQSGCIKPSAFLGTREAYCYHELVV
jgi:hypothetical protein